MPEPLVGAGGDDNYAEPMVLPEGFALILVRLVEADFVFKAAAPVLRVDRLGAVVKFGKEAERSAVGRDETKGAVGIEKVRTDLQPEAAFAVKLGDGEIRAVGGDGRVHDKIRQGLGVRLAAIRQRLESTMARKDCIMSVEQPVTFRGERVVARHAGPRSCIAPLPDQAGGGQGVQAPLQPAFASKRGGKRLAYFLHLPDSQRAPRQGAEDIPIAGGHESCHRRTLMVPSAPFFFHFPPMSEKKSFVNVEELMSQVSLEQAAMYYGISLPDLKRLGSETRTACFLACGKAAATGDRALAIQADDPAKKWHCHQYGCGKGGNLISLCDLMKPGDNACGRPRGGRFKEIAKDLLAMVGGQPGPERAHVPSPPPQPASQPKVNIPLKDSENERARALVELDRKFVVDVADMNPKASAYFRKRPFLTPEVCRKWRMGYLPRDAGGDKAGGTMRGQIIYAYLSQADEVLCYFGRDPEFEDKHQKWEKTDKNEPEPEKFHFVKGFHRGIELFGQHQFHVEGVAEKIRGLGLLVVEGPNDVIKLEQLGVPAVGLCSNNISRDQAGKVAQLAREVAGGVVTVFLDCDPEGENGMKQCLGYLAPLVPVRLAWMSKMYGGKFRGRQPESLLPEEWAEIRDYLLTGNAQGWSVS